MLHLLEALQLLQVKVPGGGPAEARRLSFRALDIEQIGHVYEGLLDHTAKRAAEPFLGLAGTRDKEPEIPLADLEKLLAKGDADLVKFLKEETGKSESALKKSLKVELDKHDAARFRTACQSDDALWKRVEPLAGLVRPDSSGYPVVIPQGSVFVTAGTDRRSSGTHYTPRSLTEPIVQYTLEPLIYVGPAEGKPKGEWKLKSAKELLELKICDMACGSGAFLVQAARYMAERLLEAWDEAKKANPNTPGITPEGTPSTGKANEALIPDEPAERKTYAMRIVAQRCLYGVDKNPLAAEMAKLSLWLLTLAKDKPFEFLDHSIRCGDSLVGLHDICQLKNYSLNDDNKIVFQWPGEFEEPVDAAINLRLKLEDMHADSVADIDRQEALLRHANEKIARLRCAADLLVAAEFWGENAKDKLERVRHAAVKSGHYVEHGPTEEFGQVAANERRGQQMFHWPLEYPEVIVKRGGFDAFIGNPPFMGGKKITGATSLNLRDFIVSHIANEKTGVSDLCAYFFLRANALLRCFGCFGLIATNTIAQGDTREVGLDQITSCGTQITRSVSSRPWPGSASLEVSEVWCRRGEWNGAFDLDGRLVRSITSMLTEPGTVVGLPYRLPSLNGKSYQGSVVLGTGFMLTLDEAADLIRQDENNKQIIFSYLSGEDLNSRPDQSASRKIINFFDWPLDRQSLPAGYNGNAASDFPLCLAIVREKVKPQRDQSKRKVYRERWWQYAEKQTALYESIRHLPATLVIPETTKYCAFAIYPNNVVFSHMTKVITFGTDDVFALLSSSIHEAWVRHYASTLETRLKYTTSDVFETFPFPDVLSGLSTVGTRYRLARAELMTKCNEGITDTYNRFHDTDETKADVQKLRQLHVEMDLAVAAAYGWSDLDLGHGFHETKQGVRFTISEPARREVLQRLLKLNHERYAEEVKQGLHEKKKRGGGRVKGGGKKKAAGKSAKEEMPLFDVEGDE